ncbi:MAG: C25 family cysteine peptidase [Candidatus Poribacteria bacterium]|nr:C25 family cysteine peptidase [Candidatus Poribacteria bacterium]
MQVRPIKRCIITCFVFFSLLFFLGTDPFWSFTYIGSSSNAEAAPVSPSNRHARTAVREGVGAQREIELVRTTPQGVTIQLFIPASDFEIRTEGDNDDQFQVSRVETQTVSFPGCRFTVQSPGALRLPVQSTFISVPVDANFQVRVVEQNFSTHKIAADVLPSDLPSFHSDSNTPKTDRFFPANLVETREAGWIRENRVLPIQFNPVQYNPVRRELRLYHRLIVEVRFLRSGEALLAQRGPLMPESAAYDAIFESVLVNPQDARQWRGTTFRVPQAPSIAAIAPRHKLSITQDGMYSVTGRDLEAVGVDIGAITPRTLTVTNRGKQVPIFVRGEGDGRLNPTDEIIFYGEQLHGEASYINPFSDENVYWLSWNAGPGSRMGTRTSLDGSVDAQSYPHFLTRAHFEKDSHFRRFPNANLTEDQRYQEFSQGLQERWFTLAELPPLPNDSWFWAQLTAPESKPFGVTLTGVAETAVPATIRIGFYGRSNTEHQADVWLNDAVSLGEVRWKGEAEYQLQNQRPQSFLQNGRNVIRIINPGSSDQLLDIVLLNWIQIDYRRTFEAKGNVLPFAITPFPDETGAINPNFEVVLENFSTPDIEIYGIDGTRYVGLAPIIDDSASETYRLPFRSTQIRPKDVDDTAIQYIALARNRFQKPKISVDTPSDLRSTHNAADYILITHKSFIEDVQPLADFRNQQGMRTKVVDVQNIYDEFNHGILNPNAIREFLSYAYDNWQPPAPTYVFLVGDTHIDLKNQPNFVPTTQVQIPGYGASASDHQFVTFRGTDSFPDMLIGRMPANNRVDVRIFVERTINYETTSQVGPWHKKLLMLAGSDLRFHSQTDRLISRNQLNGRYETERIYAPHTEEATFDERIRSPIARRVIDGFNDGASLVNYIGHGGGGIWSSSRMLDFEDPEQNLTNISQLPLVISMTCYTGSFDSNKNSLVEELLRSENGGAIAVIGATSIGLLDGDYLLNLEIFNVIFKQRTQHIGAVLAEAKTQFLINAPGYLDLAEVFTLFGDPATRLKLPNKQMQVEVEIGTSPSRETLLTVSGTLPDRTFSGDAEIIVVPAIEEAVDMPSEQENVTVTNGRFTTEIEIPASVEFDVGDVQVYAWNADEDLIGHASYNVLSRYVDNVRIAPYPVEPHQPVHLYTEVLDESGIEELTLFWSWDGIEFFTIPVSHQTGTTYKSERPIPGYPEGDLIDYYLAVKVGDGRTLQTEVVTYEFGQARSEVDLLLLDQTIAWTTTPPFVLSAQVRNQGSAPARNVPVRFYLQTLSPEAAAAIPHTTSVSTIEDLQNATPLGDVQIIPEILPGSQGVARVPWEPTPGEYLISVYVDPPSEELPRGSILEQRELNNSAAKRFTGNRFVLTPDTLDQPIRSADGTFQVTVPSDNLQTTTILTYSEEALTITNQPDIAAVSEAAPQVAYHLDVAEQTELVATVTFLKGETSDDAYIYRRDDDNGNWVRVGQETADDEHISAEVELPGTFAMLSHSDSTPPSVELTFEHQGFIDGDYVSDTPVISARIEDANGVDSRSAHIILTKNGQRVPEDEYVIAASPTNNNLLLVTYTPVLEPGEYRVRLQAQDTNGNVSDTERTGTVAGEFEIANIANFPNPFTPRSGTHFAYYLTESADEVSLNIYTITGRRIVAIDTLDASVSYNEYHYDGYDADGEPLANGVYLYKFTAQKGDIRKQKVGKIAVRK